MRRYLPTFSELVDRLTITLLKSIFIPKHKSQYEQEISDIEHDLNEIISEKDIKLNGKLIKAICTVMLTNRYIWENESKCRNGENQNLDLLRLTHSINGVRNTAKNVISSEIGERKDLKVDCLAADLISDYQNWDIFKNYEKK